VVENLKLEAQLQYKSLCYKFQNLAYKVASFPECCLLLDNRLDCLGTRLEDKLNACTGVVNENPCDGKENVNPNVQEIDALSAAELKKKEVQSKKSKRQKIWLDKLRKVKRKLAKSAVLAKKKAKVCYNCNLNISICCHSNLNVDISISCCSSSTN
jgi:zinc finger SWIM domain-containing protein 3